MDIIENMSLFKLNNVLFKIPLSYKIIIFNISIRVYISNHLTTLFDKDTFSRYRFFN